MATNQQNRKRAEAVWWRTGQPSYMLDTMRDDELEALAALGEPGGTVVPGFSGKIAEFINNYYESRKSTSDETPLGTFPESLSEEVKDA